MRLLTCAEGLRFPLISCDMHPEESPHRRACSFWEMSCSSSRRQKAAAQRVTRDDGLLRLISRTLTLLSRRLGIRCRTAGPVLCGYLSHKSMYAAFFGPRRLARAQHLGHRTGGVYRRLQVGPGFRRACISRSWASSQVISTPLLGTGLRKVPFGRYGGSNSGSDMILTLMPLRPAGILTIILH